VEQAPETVQGIKLLMSFIPSGIAFASAAVALSYGITPEVARRIETDLAERRRAEA
jgi:Na+/melibiose symporter-like transporter